MRDATAVMLAAGRVRRGNIPGALALLTRQAAAVIDCPACEAPTSSWPSRDCSDPDAHTLAERVCDCGDLLTVAEVRVSPSRHRRCHQIDAS